MIPSWFTNLSIVMLLLGAVSALTIAVDILRGQRQHMWIMNVVWPVTALFGTVFALWGYFRYGRLATHAKMQAAKARGDTPPNLTGTPFPVMVGKGTSHCGSGCTLGDISAELLALSVPAIAVWFGWKTVFPADETGRIFAVWVFDFVLAFGFGIAFQYFTIKPMRDLSPWQGLVQAVKADTLSLSAWQVGMYGFMAFAHFYLAAHVWHHPLDATMPEFWFLMQVAMLFGFATSYPVNWWLIRTGIKERM